MDDYKTFEEIDRDLNIVLERIAKKCGSDVALYLSEFLYDEVWLPHKLKLS